MMKRLVTILFFVLLFAGSQQAYTCTIVMVSKGDVVLVGNNEDWKDRNTKMWFIPASEGKYGRVCFGFGQDFGFAQGGMNDQGLFIDANALSPTGFIADPKKPFSEGPIMDRILAECANVEEAIAYFKKYNVHSLARAKFPIADKSGASVVVEWAQGKVQFVRKTSVYQISTNFVFTDHKDGPYPCWRYNSAEKLLKNTNDISFELVRSILSATHQEAQYPTVYSNIYDLKKGDVYIYNFHNFENVVKINLAEEIEKGKKSYDIPSLFSKRTNPAGTFNNQRKPLLALDSLFNLPDNHRIEKTSGIFSRMRQQHWSDNCQLLPR